MDLVDWLNALAHEMNGFYDEENNLCVDQGDGFMSSFAYAELLQLYKNRISPREAADVVRYGVMP